jgi:uncharacterized UPF0160 family protein
LWHGHYLFPTTMRLAFSRHGAKRQRLLETMKIVSSASAEVLKTAIGTHSGSFHCDEALACGMLKMLPEWKDATIVRTRDESILSQCAIVVDVGGVYDHSALRYDHHQRTFTTTFSEIGCATKLSSAGLVYKHYGKDIIRHIANDCCIDEDGKALQVSEEDLQEIFEKVYRNFVEEIDGIDNGVETFSCDDSEEASIIRNYAVTTNLSARVGRFNPSWNEPSNTEIQNEQFRKAVQLTQEEFVERASGYFVSWLPARGIVSAAMKACVESKKRILIFDEFAPWKSHMFDLEKELGVEGHVLYVLYPEDGSTRKKGKWRIQAAPVAPDSFAQRKSLPSAWCGLRDQELSAVSGIPGGVFVHAAGFIGGNHSFGGAMAMAKFACGDHE